MKKIKKEMYISFAISLTMSVMFVAGIPLIPIFAGNNWPLAIVGIVCTVVGFYGMPLMWIKYGSYFGIKRVVIAITEEHILTTSEISMYLQMREQDVKNHIVKAINKRYITGYFFDGQVLTLNERVKPSRKVEVNKCKSCGAIVEVTSEEVKCSYCGTIYSKTINN